MVRRHVVGEVRLPAAVLQVVLVKGDCAVVLRPRQKRVLAPIPEMPGNAPRRHVYRVPCAPAGGAVDDRRGGEPLAEIPIGGKRIARAGDEPIRGQHPDLPLSQGGGPEARMVDLAAEAVRSRSSRRGLPLASEMAPISSGASSASSQRPPALDLRLAGPAGGSSRGALARR